MGAFPRHRSRPGRRGRRRLEGKRSPIGRPSQANLQSESIWYRSPPATGGPVYRRIPGRRLDHDSSRTILEAYYRGEYERVLDLSIDAPLASPEGFEYLAFPVLRATLARGLSERALTQVEVARRSDVTGSLASFPFDPLVERSLVYFEGRAHEVLGDTARAVEEYSSLIDAWGDSVRLIPWLSDTHERLARLKGADPDTPEN